MRRLVGAVLGIALSHLIVVDRVDAATRRARRSASPSIVAAPVTVFECDAPRGVDAFGSAERCLRTLCVGRNVVNEYVLDDTRRQRRNPCAGIDPFERRR